MLKRINHWATPWLLFLTVSAVAQIVSSLPFTLQNNTVADATQVMANFNQIVANVNANGAKNGANNDIIALSALSTPITTAQGGTPVYVGGTSTGTANAQIVTPTSPTSFSLAAGKQVTFTAGATNTSAMTLNVAGSGATSVFRRTQLGVSATVGGEVVSGQSVTVIFDGTQFQLLSVPPVVVGFGTDWFTTTAPTGWLLRDGAAVSRTTYADLFAVIGTTYGIGNGTTTFNVPDELGRMSVMKDSASRITTACAAANTLATACGVTGGQVTIAQGNLPNSTLTTTIPSGEGSHTHLSGNLYYVAGGGNVAAGANKALEVLGSGVTGAATLPAMSGTTSLGGSGTAMTILNGSLVVNKIIKY